LIVALDVVESFEGATMKFKLIPLVALTVVFGTLTGCQSMEEMRAERAKKGEQVERMTGSNIPRKDGVSDVKIASGEAIRGIDNANAASTAAAGAGGK
jgi:hypothetical protein